MRLEIVDRGARWPWTSEMSCSRLIGGRNSSGWRMSSWVNMARQRLFWTGRDEYGLFGFVEGTTRVKISTPHLAEQSEANALTATAAAPAPPGLGARGPSVAAPAAAFGHRHLIRLPVRAHRPCASSARGLYEGR